MKMINADLESFIDFVNGLKLIGKNSRMRSKLVNSLNNKFEEFTKNKTNLYIQYCDKDIHGEPLTEQLDGNTIRFTFSKLENKEKLAKEMNELFLDEVIIDEVESMREPMIIVRDAIINSDQEYFGEQAMFYDRFCEIVEGVFTS